MFSDRFTGARNPARLPTTIQSRRIRFAPLAAGPMLNPAKDFREHVLPDSVPHRGAGEHAEMYFGRQKSFGYWNAPNGFWEIDGEPYSVAQGQEFRWFRSRILGGRTNH